MRLRRGWRVRKEREQEAQEQATGNSAQSRARQANPHRQNPGVRDSDLKAARRYEQQYTNGRDVRR